jgi:hypothetical protein
VETERWIRWAGIANSIFAIPVFLSYVYYNFLPGFWWGITIPAFSLLLAIYYRRAGLAGAVSGGKGDCFACLPVEDGVILL